MAGLPLFDGEPPTIASDFAPDERVVLHEGDATEFARTLPTGLAKLIITSPPYNIGKAYERRASIDDYLRSQEALIDQLLRVLHPNGSLCWEVGNYVEDAEVFPLDVYYYPLFKSRGLRLRNRIIWHFEHGLHCSRRFSGRYETILWFTRGDNPYTFNLDPVRVPAKYPGKRAYRGPNAGRPSGNPLGKNPSDLWTVVAQDWEQEVWEIPNVKSNHPEKTIHPCQFPVELVERCVLALTEEGDWVYDPYAGVGSALLAALRHGRRAVGCDRDSAYVQLARERIAALQHGQLPLRPLGKPVFQPTGREKVSQIPVEWEQARSTGVSYFEQFAWDLEQRGVADIDVPVLVLGVAADS